MAKRIDMNSSLMVRGIGKACLLYPNNPLFEDKLNTKRVSAFHRIYLT